MSARGDEQKFAALFGVSRNARGRAARAVECVPPRNSRAILVADVPSHDITRLLAKWNDGDEAAMQLLVTIVHDELRRLARRQMAGERPNHSLQPTALVNEAYLRLVNLKQMHWQNRAHFLAMAARLMRRILVDIARSRGYQKRGGGAKQVTFTQSLEVAGGQPTDVVALNDALEALARVDERKSQVVEMRFFGGLSIDETADV